MADINAKQFQKLLEPIQKSLGEINGKLDQHSKILDQHQANFDRINKKLDQHTEALGKVSSRLDQHTEALINIENTIKIYGDMYQVNNDNARKLERRVDVLENREGIIPPSELRLADL